jgi:hypothetical protein
MMRRIILIVFLFVLSTISGCAWQRIPVAPQYQSTDSIPIRVGVELSSDPVSKNYGPPVIQRLKDWHVFNDMIFPYRKGDPVDAVLRITVKGEWKEGANFLRGFIIGLSLYTLSPVVGPSITGTHDINSILFQKERELAKYQAHAETLVERGVLADTGEVFRKADFVQTSTLANGLAKKMRDDWNRISKFFSSTPAINAAPHAISKIQIIEKNSPQKAENLRQ